MNTYEFAMELVSRCAANGMDLKVTMVQKNNGVSRHGISRENSHDQISAIVYAESLQQKWEQDHDWDAVMDELKRVFVDHAALDFDVQEFMDYDRIKERLSLKLIGYEKNRELLKEVPHQKVMDLALVCVILVHQSEIEHGTILIHRRHMDAWNVNEEELFEDAKWNAPIVSPALVQSMESILSDLIGEDMLAQDNMVPPIEVPMYVITNRQKHMGAAVLCYDQVLSKLEQTLGAPLFILPSSIHDLIVIPDRGTSNVENLRNMVKEVNDTQVAEEEILSDQVYRYCNGILKVA